MDEVHTDFLPLQPGQATVEDTMTSRQQIVPVQLPDQVKIQVEATVAAVTKSP
jgi:hypothetical protein